MHYIVTLSEDGSKFTVETAAEASTSASNYMHPILALMKIVRGPKSCLEALAAFSRVFLFQKLAGDYYNSKIYCLKSHGGIENITVVLLHHNVSNNFEHTALSGKLHSDSIESMIAYVSNQIKT